MPETWNEYLTQLPLFLQNKVNRFIRWQDRHANLLGKLLLLEGMKRYGIPRSKLQDIKYNRHQRPYIEEDFDFNISHSGKFVVCGFSDEGQIGIDIEKVHDIKIERFARFFSTEQWEHLSGNNDLYGFFRLWTKLESVVKWAGGGMYVEIRKIQLRRDHAQINGKTCFLQEVLIDREYPCYVSTENATDKIITVKFTFGDDNTSC